MRGRTSARSPGRRPGRWDVATGPRRWREHVTPGPHPFHQGIRHVGLAAVVRQFEQVDVQGGVLAEPAVERREQHVGVGVPREQRGAPRPGRQQRDAAAVGLGGVDRRLLCGERLQVGGAHALKSAGWRQFLLRQQRGRVEVGLMDGRAPGRTQGLQLGRPGGEHRARQPAGQHRHRRAGGVGDRDREAGERLVRVPRQPALDDQRGQPLALDRAHALQRLRRSRFPPIPERIEGI